MIIEHLTMVLLEGINYFVLWLLMTDDDLD